MRQRVYIAGPYTKPDPEANTKRAIEAGNKLLDAGFAPFCPHLSHYWHLQTPRDYEDWMAIDLAWLPMADAVVRLPGESSGADREVVLAHTLAIPVYGSVEELIARPPAKGHTGYLKLLTYMKGLHCKKAADYGTDEDLFANVRASEQIGIPPWKGAWLRARDKVKRIDAYCLKGRLENEGVQDSFIDLAAYSLIAALLHSEAGGKPGN
jgi:hypothetical protein